MKAALFYDLDSHTEFLPSVPGGPARTLMGRHVAGKEFLDAYLQYGQWEELVALVRNAPSEECLRALWEERGLGRSGRRLRIVRESAFHGTFFPVAPAGVLHLPHPLENRHVWVRQAMGPRAYALSGVTHTTCSLSVVHQLAQMVTAPYEPFDALVTTSRAVHSMVLEIVDNYASYLKERHGGAPRSPVRLVTIPLAVDARKFRPPTAEERRARRAELGIGEDERVFLFFGRLSLHAKAHPLPMYQALSLAARASGRKIRLLVVGWAPNEATLTAFRDGAAAFAPEVEVTILDGTRPELRYSVWHACDVFTSLSDSIQETFGLTVAEAMATGLPVVASDWDGYRDLVLPGETGMLVPTHLVEGAASTATTKLLFGEWSYDRFLAGCGQTTAVDVRAAAAAYEKLAASPELGRGLGEAGRRHAVAELDPAKMIRRYEALWAEQEAERLAHPAGVPRPGGPAAYPVPERTFRRYATDVVTAETRLRTTEEATERLSRLLVSSAAGTVAEDRTADPVALHAALVTAAAGCSFAALLDALAGRGVAAPLARATIGWMLKFDLLEVLR